MTPTATYIAEENCLQEESRVEKPVELNFYTESVYTGEPSFNDEAYEKAVAAYNAHVATLRKIPCSPSCKGLWQDQQKVVEGKDYEVRSALLRDEKYPFLAPTEKPFAFPLVPVKSEEDSLWQAVIHHVTLYPMDVALGCLVTELKQKYSLTKR